MSRREHLSCTTSVVEHVIVKRESLSTMQNVREVNEAEVRRWRLVEQRLVDAKAACGEVLENEVTDSVMKSFAGRLVRLLDGENDSPAQPPPLSADTTHEG